MCRTSVGTGVRGPPADGSLRHTDDEIGDDLTGGVTVVCVVNPEQDKTARVPTAADELTLPEVHPNVRVPARAFFE